ncbi:phospholipid scramblase 1-like isoform X2 [Contarinia nasturtii]|uniref:phospholipid scramblase 1-like isoform X2 n=1 Tax=Contarinia nasturtii TaxID=265458 RepID=UPI0012D4BDC3|nr:phospholipid scramblase 1-like isoform X2 [Contarinia nasturtii]
MAEQVTFSKGVPSSDNDGSVRVAEPQPIRTQPNPVGNYDASSPSAPLVNNSHGLGSLGYLLEANQLVVREQANFQIGNSFHIKNSRGESIYYAREEDDCCAQCCVEASKRPFEMQIFDHNQQEVIHVSRPYSCGYSSESVDVMSPSGQVYGRIVQQFTFVYPHFKVKDHLNQTVLYIEGPGITIGNASFKVYAMNGTQVGKISKRWSGLAQEFFTDADHFGISFPVDLDVRMKATLLGAVLLINSMYYDR